MDLQRVALFYAGGGRFSNASRSCWQGRTRGTLTQQRGAVAGELWRLWRARLKIDDGARVLCKKSADPMLGLHLDANGFSRAQIMATTT